MIGVVLCLGACVGLGYLTTTLEKYSMWWYVTLSASLLFGTIGLGWAVWKLTQYFIQPTIVSIPIHELDHVIEPDLEARDEWAVQKAKETARELLSDEETIKWEEASTKLAQIPEEKWQSIAYFEKFRNFYIRVKNMWCTIKALRKQSNDPELLKLEQDLVKLQYQVLGLRYLAFFRKYQHKNVMDQRFHLNKEVLNCRTDV